MARAARIGVDFRGRIMRAVQLNRAGGIEAWTAVRRTEHDAVPTEGDLARLAGAMDRSGIGLRDVTASAPRALVFGASAELAEAPAADSVQRAGRTELARVQACDRDAIEVAWCAMPARRGEGAEYTFSGCAHDASSDFVRRCESAGIELGRLELETRALGRRLRATAPATGVGVVLEWSEATVIVLDEGRPAFERALPESGLRRMAAAIEERLGPGDPDVIEHLLFAEGVEVGLSEGVQRVVVTAMASAARSLLDEIESTVDYVRRRKRGRESCVVAIAGEGARVPGLANFAAARLGAPLCRVVPAGVDPTLAVAVGLAEWMS